MTANFVIPEGKQVNGEDEIFYFSGDDDMWLYIDGVLVLDIGGIHEPCAGEINFTTGTVTTGNKYNNAGVVSASPGAATTIGASNTLEKIFAAAGKTWDGSEESEHVMQIFYMERGGCYSNLTLTMNIPFFAEMPVSVTKETDGVAKADDVDTEFTFQIMVETAKGSNIYEPYTGSLSVAGGSENRTILADSSGYFKIKAGETATTVDTFKSTRKYYVSEVNVDGTRYEAVQINGSDPISLDSLEELIASGDYTVTYNQETHRFVITQPKTSLYKLNHTAVTNVIREEKTNLTVTKSWYDGNENHTGDTVKFRIYRSDLNDSTGKEVLLEYGEDKKTEFELSEKNGWSMTFENLTKKTLNREYYYRVEEIDPKEGYKVTYGTPVIDEDGNTSVNIRNGPDVNITVQKKWYRSDGVTEIDGSTISSSGIQVQLIRKGVRAASDNSHTVTFTVYQSNRTWRTLKTETVGDGGLIYFNAYSGGNGTSNIKVSSGTATAKGYDSTNAWKVEDIKSDITIQITLNESLSTSSGVTLDIKQRTKPTKVEAVNIGPENVGDPVTLNKSNNWSYSWGKLETPATSSDGITYTYYIKEVGTSAAYTVSYENNDGIQTGTITVKNTLAEYELPETGGIGTIRYTMGGIALITAALVLLGFSLRRRRERRLE